MKIERLTLHNFRGINGQFEIEPNGENLVLVGPNGTGKSSILSAVDFLLTEEIQDLSGEGSTRKITEKRHGPHIDASPKDAWVEADFSYEDDTFSCKRTLADRTTLQYEGKKPEDFERLEAAARRGLHYLSRDEILDLVTATAGNRASEIHGLLNLTDIRNKRIALQNAADYFASERDRLERERDSIFEDLSSLTGHDIRDDSDILHAVNELREELGEDMTESLESNFRSGIDSPSERLKEKRLLASEGRDLITQLRQWFMEDYDDFLDAIEDYLNRWEDIQADKEKLRAFNRFQLLEKGKKAINPDRRECPLCRNDWDPDELEAQIDSEIQDARELQKEKDELEDLRDKALDYLTDVRIHVERLTEFLSTYESFSESPLVDFQDSIEKWETSLGRDVLKEPLHHGEDPEEIISIVRPEDAVDLIDKLKRYVEDQPALDEMERDWEDLGSIDERYRSLLKRRQSLSKYSQLSDEMNTVHSEFINARDEILNRIYADISEKIEHYYTSIHEDEEQLEIDISDTEAGTEIDVDFYQKCLHPPHALHSEGHQDSMGLCLHFALAEWMKEESGLTLMMLDDVVMSIDRGHRRKVADLLANELSNQYQLLITTHEDDWHRHLRTMGVVNKDNVTKFSGWEINQGPKLPGRPDTEWETVEELLWEGNTSAAAHQTRRLAEWFLRESADLLEAKVQFKAGQKWEMGDFKSGVESRFTKLLGEAKNVRDARNMESNEIQARREAASFVIQKVNQEGSVLNPSIHYNEPQTTFGEIPPEELRPAVQSYRCLYNLLRCRECGSFLRVSEDRESKKRLVCTCENINYDLSN